MQKIIPLDLSRSGHPSFAFFSPLAKGLRSISMPGIGILSQKFNRFPKQEDDPFFEPTFSLRD